MSERPGDPAKHWRWQWLAAVGGFLLLGSSMLGLRAASARERVIQRARLAADSTASAARDSLRRLVAKADSAADKQKASINASLVEMYVDQFYVFQAAGMMPQRLASTSAARELETNRGAWAGDTQRSVIALLVRASASPNLRELALESIEVALPANYELLDGYDLMRLQTDRDKSIRRSATQSLSLDSLRPVGTIVVPLIVQEPGAHRGIVPTALVYRRKDGNVVRSKLTDDVMPTWLGRGGAGATPR